ncbi:hypothetical protein C7M84_021712 [Penaeus vannamei]|uniref:Apple domain-containing protein n=1 Tax=Penaeus vannamei TaxID=6689 RepID=A0A3R7PF83_PENVA|nr:hypothetical protein C7M84_021712 [Penaeus vannamei]
MADIGEQKGRPLPVRLDVTIYRDDNASAVLSRYTVNLLHMQTSFLSTNFNPFDVRECMDIPSQRTWLKITYAGIWEHGASQNPDEFKKILLEQIQGGTDMSPVRLPEVQLDHDQEFVFATVLLLEPAPYHLQFKQLVDRKPTDDDVQLEFATDDDDMCASGCLRFSTFECKSFYLCKTLNKNCFVSNYLNSGGSVFPVKACKHYQRAEIKNTKFQKPNQEIVDWIMTKGYLKEKYTDLKLPKVCGGFGGLGWEGRWRWEGCGWEGSWEEGRRGKGGWRSTRTLSCRRYVDGGNGGWEGWEGWGRREGGGLGSHTDDYEKLDGTVYTGDADQVIKSTDADKCAYHCSNATSITCRSFDYCEKKKTCYLYEQRTIDMPPEMINHTVPDCSHYSRDALVDFKKHENQVLEGSRDRYLKFVSASYCAQVCEDEPDYGCNGFDFCEEPEDVTCFLTSDHYTDEGVDIGNSPTCSHYSRSHTDDYEKLDGTVYTGDADQVIKSTDADKCAYHCSNATSITCRFAKTSLDYGCNGFDFCEEPEDVTCFLTSDHYTDEGLFFASPKNGTETRVKWVCVALHMTRLYATRPSMPPFPSPPPSPLSLRTREKLVPISPPSPSAALASPTPHPTPIDSIRAWQLTPLLPPPPTSPMTRRVWESRGCVSLPREVVATTPLH